MKSDRYMFLRLFIALICTISFLHAAEREVMIGKHAEKMEELLKDDWQISVSGEMIKFESKFDVWNVGLISRSKKRPAFDLSATGEKLQKEQKSSKYCIFLEYRDAIKRAELKKLLQLRMEYQFALEGGTDNKEGFSEISTKLQALKIPRYVFAAYSITRSEDRGVFSQVYPVDAVRKIGAAKEVIDGFFMIELPGCLVESP